MHDIKKIFFPSSMMLHCYYLCKSYISKLQWLTLGPLRGVGWVDSFINEVIQ